MERDLEKLVRGLLIEKLRTAADPAALAAEAAHELVASELAGARGKRDPRTAVSAACHGAMAAVLLEEKDLATAAVALLVQMSHVAQEAHLDPAECMTWAMEGIAPVARMAPGGKTEAIRAAIAERFMGAGEIFEGLLRAARG